jgi:hypothetical protein
MTPSGCSINPSERVVLTPAEFAAFFGPHYTWAYRQIWQGQGHFQARANDDT